MKINYINPENMAKPRGYSHAITVEGNHKTVYIGGQNAIDENGNLVGKNDLIKQTEQVLANIEKIMDKVGAKIENIVKLNIHLLQGNKSSRGLSSFSAKMGNKSKFSNNNCSVCCRIVKSRLVD